MEANELRIGNAVTYKDKTVIVEAITGDGISVSGYENGRFTPVYLCNVNLKPIKITEQVLLSFGFIIEKGHFGNEYHFNGFALYTTSMGQIGFCYDNFLKPIEYLNQIQNLYFALIGKELIEKTE